MSERYEGSVSRLWRNQKFISPRNLQGGLLSLQTRGAREFPGFDEIQKRLIAHESSEKSMANEKRIIEAVNRHWGGRQTNPTSSESLPEPVLSMSSK